jgi:hypothetical protein
MPSTVNVVESAIAEAAGRGYVFGTGEVVMRLAEQSFRVVEAICAGQMCIDRLMVAQVLAVVDGGALDLADSSVDLLDRPCFAVIHAAIRSQLIKIGAGKTKIAQSMEICRMWAGYLLGLSSTAKESGGKENEKNDCKGSKKTHVRAFLTTGRSAQRTAYFALAYSTQRLMRSCGGRPS